MPGAFEVVLRGPLTARVTPQDHVPGPTPDVVLFTAGFPIDGYEWALSGELEVLAARFRQVFIVPTRAGTVTRALPSNVVVVDLAWADGWARRAKLNALCSRDALRVLAATFERSHNWAGYRSDLRSYLDILATGILKARRLQRWIDEAGLRDAVYYDYWFENSTLALALLRRSGAIRTAVSRAHGFDIYDERWESGPVPFREFKARNLDAVFAISEHGAGYLQSKLEGVRGTSATELVRVARLGVPAADCVPPTGADPPLIVSCSMMRPHKQVHLIPDVLRACDRPLRWVHFGGGADRARVEAAAGSLPPEVTWELRGHVDNGAVQQFYRTHAVSAFLSVSATEGIPVSMMEAQRFGIPIVALAVGGVPEIVTEEVGFALAPDASVRELAHALERAVRPRSFDADQIRAAFAARFDACTNYHAFVVDLLSIWTPAIRRQKSTA